MNAGMLGKLRCTLARGHTYKVRTMRTLPIPKIDGYTLDPKVRVCTRCEIVHPEDVARVQEYIDRAVAHIMDGLLARNESVHVEATCPACRRKHYNHTGF